MPIESAEISRNWIATTRRRFAARRAEKPATKAGQIRALWPEIKAALAEGQSMKTIREWLEEEAGVSLSITSLTSYISRIRGRESRERVVHWDTGVQYEPRDGISSPASSRDCADTSHTPLASAMAVLRQHRFDIREVHADGDPTNKNLI